MENRINNLRAEINRHNILYYINSKPEISDMQYNKMFSKLLELEAEYPEYTDPNSPTRRVGNDLLQTRNRHPHPEPMLSIRSFYESEKLAGTLPDDAGLIIQPKFDGIAVELHYENGELVLALTRGNGYIGNDITENVRTIKTVPLILPEPLTLTVRGEAVISEEELKRLNKIRKKEKQELYNTTRNTVSALVMSRTSSEPALANIVFIAYSENTSQTEEQSLRLLKQINFKTVTGKIVTGKDEAVERAGIIAAGEHHYPVDGAVIKLNDKSAQRKHGNTKRVYHWAWAFKPDSFSIETKVRFVSWHVSKYGKITPVLFYDPFTHNGTTFKRAKITHAVARKLHPGNSVTIKLTGSIIPAVFGIETGEKEDELTICPACHQPLQNGRCNNENYCPSREKTLADIKEYLSWAVTIDLPPTPGGKFAAQAACMNKDAIVVQKEPAKHRQVIVADSLGTLAEVAVTLGRIDPVRNYYLQKTRTQLQHEAKEYMRKSRDKNFLNKFM